MEDNPNIFFILQKLHTAGKKHYRLKGGKNRICTHFLPQKISQVISKQEIWIEEEIFQKTFISVFEVIMIIQCNVPQTYNFSKF